MSGNSDKTILVTGVTGQQGGAVARRLRADGWRVRGLTRDPGSDHAGALRQLGVEVTTGDMTDEPSLAEPLRGVYGVYAMATPFEKGLENEVAQGRTLGNAAARAGVDHYVYSSVGSAHRRTGIPHFESKREVEKHLEDLDLPLTIVRPVFFMENLLHWSSTRDEQGLALMAPLSQDTPVQMLAVDDLAAVAGVVFARPAKYVGKSFDVAGDELTLPEAAGAVAQQFGEPVRYLQLPWEGVRSRSEDTYLLYDWLERKGYSADIKDCRELYPELLDFRAWVASGRADALRQAEQREAA